MNGIINIYKEKGYTSFDVVAKLRGICHIKKIGHTGTLDPDAEGVLPVCVGNATALCELLTDKTKEYETVLLLGVVTDTQDISGKIIEKKDVNLNKADVISCMETFVGEIEQIPPMYSAIKVNGKKLYELAREGKSVERKSRTVFIHSIDIVSIDIPRVKLRVVCSKGTYIRALCNDIGMYLKCGGTMESLVRTRSGMFGIEDAIKLDQVETLARNGDLEKRILSVREYFRNYKSIRTYKDADKFLHNGNLLRNKDFEIREDIYSLNTGNDSILSKDNRFCVYDSEGVFYAVYEFDKRSGGYKPYKMFIP
ncbi:MAG: tRNA pseudouridine(55) synthase TruB [Lachnospiraceae bacterium]|nr:tRNA pseudouridine(55) synthase TruB [Lachnospiraceae bacterium]